jgi:hypothetical protein
MLPKYRVLLRHSEQRLNAGRWRLVRRQRTLDMEMAQHQYLLSELELERKLYLTSTIDGMEVSRQQLFSWLRKMSVDQYRTQDLRLRLRSQKKIIDQCALEFETEQERCRQLEIRYERYKTLLEITVKSRRLRQLEIDESEMEEHLSWFRS